MVSLPNSLSPKQQEQLLQGKSLLRQGRVAEAERFLAAVLASAPDAIDALDAMAELLIRSGRFEQALEVIASASKCSPASPAPHRNSGFVLMRLDRPVEALAAYDRALALDVRAADMHYSRGIVLDRLRRWDEALASFDEALRLAPDLVTGHAARGAVLQELGRLEAALASFDAALARDPGHLAAHFNRGNVLFALGRDDEALQSYDAAIAIDTTRPEIHTNRGNVLQKLKRDEKALASYETALALAPDFAEARTNRGNLLNDLKRHAEALADHDAAIAARPDFAQAHVNRGMTLFVLGRLEDAVASYENALARDDRLAEAYYGRAIALEAIKRHDEALSSYKAAFALDPALPFLLGKLLHTKAHLCDWSGWNGDIARLAEKIARGEKASPPFPLLALIDDPQLHRAAAEIYARHLGAGLPPAEWIAPHAPRSKIRLGYFSADFHDHATAVLTAELFEKHDRSRFELFAYSFGPDRDDPMRKRLAAAFDHFIDVRSFDDRAVAMLARQHEIDIAVDLKGYTGDARPGIFHYRAAPVQVNYLGYPGTLGAGHYDYLLADETIIPQNNQRYFTEQIVYLPDSYQPNDTKRPVAGSRPLREAAGLPENAIVFCCFSNAYKISPAIFDDWMAILRAVEGSVLWLLQDNATTKENLRLEAAIRGVAAERLVFAPHRPLADHLARYTLADIFLDTLPYNAHTTASDALWSGLPIITRVGESFPARVCASLLKAVGLPELVASTATDYVALAVALAKDPVRLRALKQRLIAQRTASPLFDSERFARNIELAFAGMLAQPQRQGSD